jgi:general secretion pathway protein G
VKERQVLSPLGIMRQRRLYWLGMRFPTGFTLVELLFVIIIVGTLAAIVLPRLSGRAQEAKTAAAEAFIKTEIATALRLYEMDNGNFPSTEEGLGALLFHPETARNWRGPYLQRKPLDPWGRNYQYQSPGHYNPKSYDLYSLGKDTKESYDDITNW